MDSLRLCLADTGTVPLGKHPAFQLSPVHSQNSKKVPGKSRALRNQMSWHTNTSWTQQPVKGNAYGMDPWHRNAKLQPATLFSSKSLSWPVCCAHCWFFLHPLNSEHDLPSLSTHLGTNMKSTHIKDVLCQVHDVHSWEVSQFNSISLEKPESSLHT